MKHRLRTLFGPLLAFFERGDAPYAYKPSHRWILLFMSAMFIGLATLVLSFVPDNDPGYLLPVVLFGGTGVVGIIVGGLGTDRAVARIWGSR